VTTYLFLFSAISVVTLAVAVENKLLRSFNKQLLFEEHLFVDNGTNHEVVASVVDSSSNSVFRNYTVAECKFLPNNAIPTYK
jgi:hypothetical protein